MKKLFTTLLTFTSLFAFGQVPQGFSYQAVAFNSAGSPVVSSTVSVRISVLDNSASGTALYTETHSKTTNASGLYSLTIGQGTPTLGTFNTINWAVNSKFLKVELDPTGGTSYTTVGTSQFLSVPYALIADSVLKTPTKGLKFYTKQFDFQSVDTFYQGIEDWKNIGIVYHLIDGEPENITLKLKSMSSGFKLENGCSTKTVIVGSVIDTIFDGMYLRCPTNSGTLSFYPSNSIRIAYHSDTSVSPGSKLIEIDVLAGTKLLNTISRNIFVKSCPFKTFNNKIGVKSYLSSTCSSIAAHNTTVAYNNSVSVIIGNVLNSTSNITAFIDCNGVFYAQSQSNSITYNGKDYSISGGSFTSTGNITLNFNVWDPSTSTSSTCSITYYHL